MKLVMQQGDTYSSETIEEYQIEDLIQSIQDDFGATRINALPYELARFRIPKGIIVIYLDNRRLRTRNFWYEVRGLSCLAKHLNQRFFHSVSLKYPNGDYTEIDGLDVETQSIMVELKSVEITQKWIDFLDKKREFLNLQTCYVCSPRFSAKLQVPSNIQTYQINLDNLSLFQYYMNQFSLPDWFKSYIKPRHVRILANNGLWYGIKRKLTTTAKYTPSTKITRELRPFFLRENIPIRLYYSLARMVIPQRDYYGLGYPLPYIIAAFDIDSDHKPHIIGPEGYCLQCLDSSKEKCKLLSEKLIQLGYPIKVLLSGFKGYHIYCLNNENQCLELSLEKFQELLKQLYDSNGKPLCDNFNFRAQNGAFDLHRIFKLPESVDAVSGVCVKERLERIPFNDKISKLS